MAFFLFLVVNAALFIRPGEIIPALLGWEIYFYAILACLAVGGPDVLANLLGRPLSTQPITLCAFGIAMVIPLPFLFGGDLGEAWRTSFYFSKTIIYFILLVSLVTTPARLRMLLVCNLICAGAVTLLAVLRYHEIIHLSTVEALDDSVEGMYGASIAIKRLQATGIFRDPNELCVLLSALLPICLYFLFAERNLLLRGLSLCLIPLFGYAVYLTQSRGGFMAFAGSLGVLAWMRFGWKKAALIGATGLPVLLLLFAGRQTDISTKAGTAQTRIELWRDWMQTFRENMLLGNGMSLAKEDTLKSKRPDEKGRHLAHNSYLQSFADLGFLGGCLYTGAFFLALWSLYRYNAHDTLLLNLDLKTLQPYLFAAITAYCLGMMSLSINYIAPTFMIPGIAAVYAQMARPSVLVGPPPIRFDLPLVGRILGVGVCTILGIYVFIRFLA